MMKNQFWKRITALGLSICICLGAAMPLMGATYAMDSGVSANDVPEDGLTCACDVKCTIGASNVDCVVCAADITGCVGTEQTSTCVCDEKCTDTTPNMDCVVCAADVTGCTGTEPAPAPTCACDVKCTDTTPNMDCVVCAADVTGCIGAEPAPAPTCACDVKCTDTTPNMDCVVCAVDVTGCIGTEPEPAPTCACDVKCTDTTPNMDCVVCAADVTGCIGTEPAPAPTCFCDVKCTADALNGDCVVCAADVTGCVGVEPEPTPTCACDLKCTTDALNGDCVVCVADLAGCVGKEPEPAPACDCMDKCEVGFVKADCPVCKTDLTGCTGAAPEPIPDSGVTLSILPPYGWYTREADVTVRITDDTGSGFARVEVKIEKNGSWRDITDDLDERDGRYTGTVEISENCTVYVAVTGHDGKTFEKSRYIECFDRTAPTLRAAVDGRLLRAEADDDLSGVMAIYINGDRYTDLTNGTLDVNLRDLEDEFEQITVQAVDGAGNKSKTVQVKNPDYREREDDQDCETPAPPCPESYNKPAASTTPTTPTTNTPPASSKPSTNPGTTSSGTTTEKPSTPIEQEPEQEPRDPAPLTPDGQATVVDNVTDEDGKEFFTFITPNENVFYLVIDRQRDSENVYFLNAVTEADLLALAEQDKEPEVSAVPDPEPPTCDCKDKCAPGEVDTGCPVCVLALKDCTGKAPATAEEPEEPKEGGGFGTILFILIAALAAGGAGYYFKIYKPKRELDDAEDFDEITDTDEETVNEDEDLSQTYDYQRDNQLDEPEEPDYPDYPDEYGNEPEDRA